MLKITYCSFNQDSSCLVVAYNTGGFSIFQINPLQKMYESPEWFNE